VKPAVKEVADILKQLYELYQKALVLGSSIPNLEPSAIVDILDQRSRILLQTSKLQNQVKELEADLAKQSQTPSEAAFLNEQKTRLHDLSPRFIEQERRVNSHLKTRLVSIRGDLVSHNRSANAIRQYLSAPQSKPLV